jgi:hypothetical protein
MKWITIPTAPKELSPPLVKEVAGDNASLTVPRIEENDIH